LQVTVLLPQVELLLTGRGSGTVLLGQVVPLMRILMGTYTKRVLWMPMKVVPLPA